MIWSDLKQTSKPYTLVQPKKHHCLVKHFHRAKPTASSRLYILLRSNFAQIRKIDLYNTFVSFSCLLYKTPNRSDRLFYPLILYYTTCLCKLSNRWDRLFYSLTLDSLFIYCTSYQIGQRDFFTLWCFYGLFAIQNTK